MALASKSTIAEVHPPSANAELEKTCLIPANYDCFREMPSRDLKSSSPWILSFSVYQKAGAIASLSLSDSLCAD
jgi:hypothetical protein